MNAETSVNDRTIDVEPAVRESIAAEEAPATEQSPAHSAADDDDAASAAERDEYLDSLRRLQAEFDNFRKRVRRESEDDFKRAVTWTVDRLLPVLDAFDGAKQHHAEVFEPIEAVLHGALVAVGVERIEPLGEPFDPDSHDAVAYDDPEQTDDLTIVEVLRAGYRCRGQLVRPAMVRVGRQATTEPPAEEPKE